MSYFPSPSAIGVQDPQTTSQQWVDDFNTSRSNPSTKLEGTTFVTATKDTSFWAETVTGSGTVTQGSGQIVMATGATANSTVQYRTVRVGTYIPGTENIFRAAIKTGDTGTVNNIRNWGAFTATDGVFFQMNGTILNVVTRLSSVDTAVPKASWNGNNNFTPDTNYHTYEIRMSTISVRFYIDKVLVHTFALATALPSATFNLPITLQNNNSGGSTSNLSLTSAVAVVSRTGQLVNESKFAHLTGAATTTVKSAPGKLQTFILNRPGTLCTIYDNTAGSGTVIASIDINNSGAIPVALPYNIPFEIGLTLVITGAGADITVVYE